MPDTRSTILPGKRALPHTATKSAESVGSTGLAKVAIKREHTRTSNHRVEDRLRGILQDVAILFRRKTLSVGVINVSSRGAMLESDISVRIGETIDILFAEKHKTGAIVRWVRDGRFGVEFVEETICWDASDGDAPILRFAPLVQEEPRPAPRRVNERAPRQPVARRGSLLAHDLLVPVRVRDISPGGAAIECDRTLRAGREVELDLGEAGIRSAEVRWSRNGKIGLRFAADFDLKTLSPDRAGRA
ncbi:PilZ domain-containing protein [Sphingosinicella sp. BN140058]|uniref:PilZ domain-containing protein n=1 Tax=Sphingosinicella sp. BN140058 TaxID=1892855 RepID=UPI0010105356|nr:PilZ domain-containing protein [Sphingosinicella sp. BN140058]QAY78339.1 PilZ domain-containing protein [Sphingosinicella sp. BN140058]